MTETTRPVFQGQIETPNPIELFWEKNKRPIQVILTVVVLTIISVYGIQYYQRQQINRQWSEFNNATNLAAGYAEEGSATIFLQPGTQFRNPQQYVNITHAELITELRRDLKNADEAKIDQAIKDLKGTPAEPALLWIKATRAVDAKAWDDAKTTLADLKQRFPEHPLCVVSDHPIQWQKEIKDKDAEKEKKKKRKKNEPPKLEPPVKGSSVSLLEAQIERQKAFQKSNEWIYEAPKPDASPVAVVKLSTDEEFKIAFYSKQAPEHVKSFLEEARKGYFDNMVIDEVQRQGENTGFFDSTPTEQMHFGLPITKTEADRSKWEEARKKKSETELPFEDNDLSHFPGMVATEALQGDKDKSSGNRIWINANDCAGKLDGTRVIFARVIEGLDVVKRICTQPSFTDDDMKRAGKGQLQQDIKITSIKIEGE